MKKQFLFGMAAVAALCSCSNNEVMEAPESLQTPIAFGTYVGNSVNGRALVNDKSAIEGTIRSGVTNRAGIGVFAYYTGQDTYASANGTPNFMYNQQLEYRASKWGYTPLKYWPNNNDDKVSFFAYAPYSPLDTDGSATSATDGDNITGFSTNTATGDPTVTFTVNGTVKSQQDLLYADASQNSGATKLIDRIKQTTVDNANISISEQVKFDFKHALARIGFNVEASVDKVIPVTGTDDDDTGISETHPNGTIAESTTIAVQKVELIGKFYESGTLNLNNHSWTNLLPADLTERNFTLNYEATPSSDTQNTSESDFNSVAEAVTTTKQQLNANDSYVMVIPQTFLSSNDSGQIKIKVTYTVTTTDANLSGGASTIENVITSSPFEFTFEQGNAYMFNLHLGLTSVKFDADVTSWNDGGNTIVNVPINKN